MTTRRSFLGSILAASVAPSVAAEAPAEDPCYTGVQLLAGPMLVAPIVATVPMGQHMVTFSNGRMFVHPLFTGGPGQWDCS